MWAGQQQSLDRYSSHKLMATQGQNAWNSQRSIPLPMFQLTQFEQETARLGLITERDMLHSKPLFAWVKRFKNSHYVPEEILNGFGLDVQIHEGWL